MKSSRLKTVYFTEQSIQIYLHDVEQSQLWYSVVVAKSLTYVVITLCDPMDCSTPDSSDLHCFPGICSDSCPLSQWCYLTISSSATPFSFCLYSFPASGSFPRNQLFESGGQSIGALASASVLAMNIQGWFPFGLTSLISLPGTLKSLHHNSKASILPLLSNSHIHIWLLGNHSFDCMDLYLQNDVIAF